ncbi:hypothetical protein Mal64_19310 [Pseudobythopirellula maris]|uniref:DUF1015 domain-containing protein n=1 Tax=Pseudobythopirellula maris TaxID=2527991 RepID=A0A5C5ZMQ3_9BACT|nr:DUF1015 domain-containing protein [Pseudobythopirellula maris]TWT88450.1 hypothetical protein Mal64_19310 [Pseudobythopirellula maris]
MPEIEALRAIRYDLGHVGSLSDVVAPPYDVIDAELLEQLCEQSPYNSVRLILGKDEPGDSDTANRYTRSAKFLKEWMRDGVLFTEANPAVYAYHQTYTEAGVEYTRRGFMCRVRLERFGEGKIHPHEETHGGAKADRLKLWKATKTNMSQVFGLFPDDENEAQNLLEEAIMGVAPLEAADHLGVVNRLWPVNDVAVISKMQAVMGPKPVYIADGHHRYETACNYRDELAAEMKAKGEEMPDNHPANYVLMMCVSMSDPGMLVLPTHRLFRGMPEMTAEELTAKLGDKFTTEPAGEGPSHAPEAWESIETEDNQGTLALYTAGDKKWTLCRVTDAGRDRMAEIAPEQSKDWQGLGVSLLHKLVMEDLLQAPETAAPKYVRAIDEVVEGLTNGEAAGRDLTGQISEGGVFNLAAVVMPATLEHIRQISNHGERMPAKSTYFYPKVLSGLLFNPLE